MAVPLSVMTRLVSTLGIWATLIAAGVFAQNHPQPRPLPGNPLPEFPEMARAADADADVEFSAHVRTDGTVDEVKVLTVSTPHLGFEEAIVAALKRWRFEPAVEAGKPVHAWYTASQAFVLTYPGSRARMYPQSSATVWRALKAWLKDQRIAVETANDKTQLLTTTPVEILPDRFGFNAPSIDPKFAVASAQWQVFVSPYIEPARVYVGSTVDGREMGVAPGGRFRRLYQVPQSGGWLLEQLSKALGSPGSEIPRSWKRRAKASRAMVSGKLDPCLTPPDSFPPDVKFSKSPAQIKRVEPVYPVDSIHAQQQATVEVDGAINEDGYVVLDKVEGPNLSPEFLSAASGAIAMWLYSPTFVGSCAVPAGLYVTVQFKLVR